MKIQHIVFYLTLALFFAISSLHAQLADPVKWRTDVEKVGKDTYLLKATAEIEHPWHMYSQEESEAELGPIPTSFEYAIEGYELVGGTEEEIGVTVFDPVFEAEIKYFEHSATFVQKIKADPLPSEINATVEYMACDDANCLAPEVKPLVYKLNESVTGATKSSVEGVSFDQLQENMIALFGMLPEDIVQKDMHQVLVQRLFRKKRIMRHG